MAPRSALTHLEQLLNIARALVEQRRPWSFRGEVSYVAILSDDIILK